MPRNTAFPPLSSTRFPAKLDWMDAASRGSILVIEDDDDLRDALLIFLGSLGGPVFGVENGAAALVALREDPLPSLIILDIMMPRMDGRAFRRRQLEDVRVAHIPVIVITALPEAQRGAEFRGVHWIAKPFRAAELKRLVASILA